MTWQGKGRKCQKGQKEPSTYSRNLEAVLVASSHNRTRVTRAPVDGVFAGCSGVVARHTEAEASEGPSRRGRPFEDEEAVGEVVARAEGIGPQGQGGGSTIFPKHQGWHLSSVVLVESADYE
jgi:hypothetical protein